MRLSLQDIGESFECDKFTVHRFGAVYDRYLGCMRDEPITILEIGVGGEAGPTGGASLRTWEQYFTSARILGIDIYDKSHLDNDRITTRVCDQSDQQALAGLGAEFGPFDVIIDDGSHKMGDVLHAFFALFGLLKPGGYYIIEDIQTSYWPHYGGSSLLGDYRETAIYWVKMMVDVVNRSKILWPDHPALRFGFEVEELHVHHNICVIQRAENAQSSAILDAERRKEWLESDQRATGLTLQQAELLNHGHELRKKFIELVSLLKV